MTSPFTYEPFDVPGECAALRREVRDFLATTLAGRSGSDIGRSWMGFDREFSREVGRRGWIGMGLPKRYGGHERSLIERYVVVEEMLAAAAPVGSHWIADRQSGPLLLRHGSEAQRQRFLPLITSGDIAFCIGMSEPDAGSDLASMRARATPVEGGWRLNGSKIWTTNAHHCEFMIGLFRTGGPAEVDRNKGLSQFMIDLSSSGIDIRPIVDLTGDAHFNEVAFDNVFVPEDMIIGKEGEGWAQVNAELAFERSGPDRFLSTFLLLPATMDALKRAGNLDRPSARRIGEAVAEIAVLREMSISIQGMLIAGKTPLQEAALTKQLGTTFEQRTPELVRELCTAIPTEEIDRHLTEMLNYLTQFSTAFSLRGGTREILRGIIARGLGLR